MKTSVLDFIDSNTLRRHLSDQKLEPAIECILISNCRSRSLEDKLEALQERYNTYTSEDFKRGVYNSYADDFRSTLKQFIDLKKMFLKEIGDSDENIVYELNVGDYYAERKPYSNLDVVMNIGKRIFGNRSFSIIRQKIDAPETHNMTIELNHGSIITDVYINDFFLAEFSIQEAYAEIPHRYKPGDIVGYGYDHAVVVPEIWLKQNPEYLSEYSSSDMSLRCLRFCGDVFHPCGGAFRYEHIPILEAEICKEEDLSEKYKPLIAVSRFYKGKISFEDSIEMYSNGMIYNYEP